MFSGGAGFDSEGFTGTLQQGTRSGQIKRWMIQLRFVGIRGLLLVHVGCVQPGGNAMIDPIASSKGSVGR